MSRNRITTDHFLLGVSIGKLEVVQQFIDQNKDYAKHINTYNKALSYAANNVNEHLAMVTSLLTVPGICINYRNSTGDTPLISAARSGHKNIVSTLLATPGIDINATDIYGNTALFWAARNSRTLSVAMLMNALADISIKNNKGETAEMVICDDVTRFVFNNSKLENKFASFSRHRIALTERYKADHAPSAQQKEEHQAAVRMAMHSVSSDIQYIQANLDLFNSGDIGNLIFDFANLIACLGEKQLDKLSHSVHRVAAKMGHDISKRIVQGFMDVDNNGVIPPSSLSEGESKTSTAVQGIFGVPQNNSHSDEPKVASSEQSSVSRTPGS